MSQIDLLKKCLKMVIDSNVCPETPKNIWPLVLMFAHIKGYLYTNKDASAFACGFCVPNWDEKYITLMPSKEEGKIGYVTFAVSESKNKFDLLKMLKSFKRLHDLDEVIYYRRNNEHDFKRMRLKHEFEKSINS